MLLESIIYSMSSICLPALVPVAPCQQGDDRSIWRIWHFQLQISGWKMKTETLQQTPKDLSSDWDEDMTQFIPILDHEPFTLRIAGTNLSGRVASQFFGNRGRFHMHAVCQD